MTQAELGVLLKALAEYQAFVDRFVGPNLVVLELVLGPYVRAAAAIEDARARMEPLREQLAKWEATW